jgi:hypothetical protein
MVSYRLIRSQQERKEKERKKKGQRPRKRYKEMINL